MSTHTVASPWLARAVHSSWHRADRMTKPRIKDGAVHFVFSANFIFTSACTEALGSVFLPWHCNVLHLRSRSFSRCAHPTGAGPRIHCAVTLLSLHVRYIPCDEISFALGLSPVYREVQFLGVQNYAVLLWHTHMVLLQYIITVLKWNWWFGCRLISLS